MNVVICGASGNLGHLLVPAFELAGHSVRALGSDDVNFLDQEAVQQIFKDIDAQLIVNAVAYNDVDGAEDSKNQPLAMALNAELPKTLAQIAKTKGAAIIHYSTDFVFDGTKREGYREDDAPNPISFYGQSKRAGEMAVEQMGGYWYVVRLSKIFGVAGASKFSKPSFPARMLELTKTKPELTVVDEGEGRPTFTKDVAEATVALALGDYPSGYYHMVNEGAGVTPYQFIKEVFAAANVTTPVRAVSSAEFPTVAKRPACAVLLNTKLPPLRARQDAIRAFFDSHS